MTEKLRQVIPWILAAAAIVVAAAALVVALRTTAGQNIMSAMAGSEASANGEAAAASPEALEEQISSLPEGEFQMEIGAPPADCMEHQGSAPSASYTAGADADTGAILGMLRYYTMHAGKPFCDAQPATAADMAWAQLYVDLGANPANVQGILDTTTTG
jgi:hypothetical protein